LEQGALAAHQLWLSSSETSDGSSTGAGAAAFLAAFFFVCVGAGVSTTSDSTVRSVNCPASARGRKLLGKQLLQ
jgi:hypothetical protein